MPIRVQGPVYKAIPATAYWNGTYIGVHGGYAWARNDISTFGADQTFSPSGGIFGIQLGYNRHISRNWVLGYEIDISATDLTGTRNVPGFADGTFDMNMFGTARTRLGYANGPWLFYGTAGVAWATTTFRLSAPVMFLDRPHIGYAVGAGVEYALNQRWSAKLEYLYADLGETNGLLAGNTGNTDLTLSTVRLGLNYRFADVAPQLAAFPVKAPVYVSNWSGPYIGVHAGYGWGDFESNRNGVIGVLDPKGGFAGIQSGYNWQISRNLIVGIESDSSWGAMKHSVGAANIDIDALGTVRGRLGYTMDRLMVYATGGLAWAHADSVTAIGLVINYDRFYLGWAAGAGIEYALTPRWSAKLEYIYADYGALNEGFGGNTIRDTLTTGTVKVGVNYRASVLDLLGGRW